jgi:hypothetical protein
VCVRARVTMLLAVSVWGFRLSIWKRAARTQRRHTQSKDNTPRIFLHTDLSAGTDFCFYRHAPEVCDAAASRTTCKTGSPGQTPSLRMCLRWPERATSRGSWAIFSSPHRSRFSFFVSLHLTQSLSCPLCQCCHATTHATITALCMYCCVLSLRRGGAEDSHSKRPSAR